MSAAKNAVTAFEIKRALAEKHYKDFFITENNRAFTYQIQTDFSYICDSLQSLQDSNRQLIQIDFFTFFLNIFFIKL